ncbi:hypothetical protein LguiB_021108 [Lonicera macranthoides]
MEKLPYLEYLNRSFNELEGEVPKKGAFGNASAISILGNSKLCGGIEELKLASCQIKVKKPRRHLAFKVVIIASEGAGETEAAIVEEEREAVNEIEVEQYTINTRSLFHGSEKLQKCIIAVLEIGLACSAESPKQQMGLNDILRELHQIKTAFLGDDWSMIDHALPMIDHG